jgi:hypothetical protein
VRTERRPRKTTLLITPLLHTDPRPTGTVHRNSSDSVICQK